MKPATKLLRWYRRHGRNLPWRQTRDPYKILVSEIMLQQTQVERGLVYYNRWLDFFPNWKTLAKASNADVLHVWAGLGYNRRALALRDIARQIEKRKKLPITEEEWMTIKGIGPYTAAAISAFAQKKRTLPIDTNIRRVLGRYYFGILFPQISDDKQISTITEEFLPKRGAYYDVPQALFDFAGMICSKSPKCQSCLLKNECKSASLFLSGDVKIPKAMNKKTKECKHRNKPHPDRIYRGRALKLIRENKKVDFDKIGPMVDPIFDPALDADWIKNILKRMEKDGFLQRKKTSYRIFE
jgi:A/G-specific adenine glycosylase